MGYYDRGVTDESGEHYRIDIARYLCRRKGSIKALHCTFSLLPYPLIPYFSHTIEITIEALSFWLEGNSLSDVLNYVCRLGQKEPLDMGVSTLYRLKGAVQEGFEKAMTQGDYKAEVEEGLEDFIERCKDFHCLMEDREFVGPSAISLDYYRRSEGHFLFGRPSQKRIKRDYWQQRKNFFSDTQPRYPP
jgi:hypothetical protein